MALFPAARAKFSVASRPVRSQPNLTRLQSLTALSNLPIDAMSGSGGDELKSWYHVWFGHWNAARKVGQAIVARGAANGQTVAIEAEIKALEREQTTNSRRLTTTEGPPQPGFTKRRNCGAESHIGRRPAASPCSPVPFPRSRSAIRIPRGCAADSAGGRRRRRRGALTVAIAVWRGVPIGDWFRRWPQPLAMVVLRPGGCGSRAERLGLLGAALTLLLATRSGLRRARYRGHNMLRLGTMR